MGRDPLLDLEKSELRDRMLQAEHERDVARAHLNEACDLALYYAQLGYGFAGESLKREKAKIDRLRKMSHPDSGMRPPLSTPRRSRRG